MAQALGATRGQVRLQLRQVAPGLAQHERRDEQRLIHKCEGARGGACRQLVRTDGDACCATTR